MSGPGALLYGFRIWRTRPGLMALGVLPALLVLALMVTGLVVLIHFSGDVVAWATPFLDDAQDPVRDLVRVLGQAALVGGYVFASWALFVALTLLVGEPFYQKIWRETEIMLSTRDGVPGQAPDGELSAWRSVADSTRLLGRSVALAVAVAAIGLVPGVGTVVAAMLGTTVAGWLLAGGLVARPLEARGLDARARADLLRPHRKTLLGFGFSVQLCFWIPLGAVVAMPAAVVGATRLVHDLLGEQSS